MPNKVNLQVRKTIMFMNVYKTNINVVYRYIGYAQ